MFGVGDIGCRLDIVQASIKHEAAQVPHEQTMRNVGIAFMVEHAADQSGSGRLISLVPKSGSMAVIIPPWRVTRRISASARFGSGR